MIVKQDSGSMVVVRCSTYKRFGVFETLFGNVLGVKAFLHACDMVWAKRHFLTKFNFFGTTRFQHFYFWIERIKTPWKKCWRSCPTFFSWRFVAFFLFVPPKPETFASLGVLQPMSQFLLGQRCGARVLLHATLREARRVGNRCTWNNL